MRKLILPKAINAIDLETNNSYTMLESGEYLLKQIPNPLQSCLQDWYIVVGTKIGMAIDAFEFYVNKVGGEISEKK